MFTRCFITVGLVAATAACARTGDAERAAPVHRPICAAARAPSTGAPSGAGAAPRAAGMRVFVEPESGAFVEPVPGTTVEPAYAPTTATSAVANDQPVELESPQGGRMVRLDGRQRHYMVAHAKGTGVDVQCDQRAP